MNYDNIIYPLDKIYSTATGVGYPVSGAAQGDNKPDYFHITNISNETGEFSIGVYSSGTMEYSLDGKNWNDYDLTTKPSVSVNAGGEIYLRGTNFTNNDISGDSVINFNKYYNVAGNFMSLSNYRTMDSVTTISDNNYIKFPFYKQTYLVSAGDLNFGNVTEIGYKCLFLAFGTATSLTTPPDFSNFTTIGQYGLDNTFSYCTSLTYGPDLSNVTSVGEYALYGTFGLCVKISTVTAPNIADLRQNNVLNGWLAEAGMQATGTKTVRVPTGATISYYSTSGIPTGWTRTDY